VLVTQVLGDEAVLVFWLLNFAMSSLGYSQEVVGDQTLFDVVKAAMVQNLEAFKSGQCQAIWTKKLNASWHTNGIRTKVFVQAAWDQDHFFAENAERVLGDPASMISDPVEAAAIRRGDRKLLTRGFRILIKDKKCWQTRIGNRVEVIAEPQIEGKTPMLEELDVRPKFLWPDRRNGPIEEIVGPHPNVDPQYVKQWKVEHSGNIVRITRVDQPANNGGTLTMEFDLSKGGNIVASNYKSQATNSKEEYTWSQAGNGKYYLARRYKTEKRAGEEATEELFEVIEFSAGRPDPSWFELDRLRLRPGAQVIDHVANKKYNLPSIPITEEKLKQLGTKTGQWIQKRGMSAP
jgi:hypothetical protein